ncbi:hypothetical protein EO98_16615 [Methanosarcina sp. 2.H.T.1A.6]|uniref:hypothetical protein n=1 Tax=unclassified Methanosarcina TaxID=2644672 RepID=UPI000621D3C2|nr:MULTISPECIES: hypothetical protein [unclassified Methanosarcina]KKG14989.1 hypothetical protein EO94_03665 [Methanosarcina sp. 2.H.T.1A.3]KKG20596.1 hypothetical protein EO96_13225 [Methanosarcina sp. 2.H.T.1A.8]KKG22005.1 hypothetical protein EO98_16615 [Methanosarcina sp. 2.H.T.1A.6]KKG28642.1 hypothetical protein EO97_14090 [Methanosarcina sp. 2.H.T.1A.15]
MKRKIRVENVYRIISKLYWGIGHLSIGSVGVWGIKKLVEVYSEKIFFSQMPYTINISYVI